MTGGRNAVRLAVVAAGALAMLVPLAWMVLTSLKSYEEILSGRFLPATPQWGNYAEALGVFPFGRYFLNSVLLSLLVVSGTVVSCSLGGYAFAWLAGRRGALLFGLLLTGVMLPGQVTFIPLFRRFAAWGWLDTYLPLAIPAWLGTNVFALFLMRQAFLRVPRSRIEAARVDGASELRIFWSIALPAVRPALLVVTLLTFVASWNDLWGPLVFLQDERLYTLPVGMVMVLGETARPEGLPWHLHMAAATVMVAPVVLLLAVAQGRFPLLRATKSRMTVQPTGRAGP